MLCCTLLVGSCSDEEATVRAAAVRALAMAVMFRTLREVSLSNVISRSYHTTLYFNYGTVMHHIDAVSL